ncbi:MAG: tail fiber domain-containing protein [Sphingobacteriales bacterium]|nr:tail fiber domain-containing protein [Sphingobacteriales bacterium]
MKKIFLLFVAVFTLPALLQAQAYGVHVDDVSQYSIRAINGYYASSYGAYIKNNKDNVHYTYGIYSNVYNHGSGDSYSVYARNTSLGSGTPFAGYFYGSYSSSAPVGYGIYAISSQANNINYGIYTTATGSSSTNYGLYASSTSSNSETNYGVYATASNSGTGGSYAAYFNGITRLDGGTDVNAASGGNVVIGDFTSINMGIDENEIQARNDSIAASLYLNWNGGKVQIGDGPVGIAPYADLHIKQRPDGITDSAGIRLESGYNTNYWQIGTASTNNLWFVYNGTLQSYITTSGTYTVSDRTLKHDIQPLQGVLSKVMRLKPSSYIYNQDESNTRVVGFVAQEVKEIFPDLVKVENGINTLNYDHYSTLAIAAIQELNDKLESKERENEDLKKELKSVKDEMAELRAMVQKMNAAVQNCCLSDKTETGSLINDGNSNNYSNAARLEQNAPNPFYAKTIIQHYVPEEANSAQPQITALDGKVMTNINLSKGFSTTTINGSELAAGTYIYALIIDGKNTAAKEMILTK